MNNRIPKRRWFRMSLRTLFVMVAIAAVALGWWRRAHLLEKLSLEHAAQAQMFADSAFAYQKWPQRAGEADDKRRHLREQHALHREWSKRYRLAIWRPWLNPEGDLPIPKPYNAG